MDETSQEPPHDSPRKPIGPFVGALIIVLLLIAGALYFWLGTQRDAAPDIPPYILGDSGTQE